MNRRTKKKFILYNNYSNELRFLITQDRLFSNLNLFFVTRFFRSSIDASSSSVIIFLYWFFFCFVHNFTIYTITKRMTNKSNRRRREKKNQNTFEWLIQSIFFVIVFVFRFILLFLMYTANKMKMKSTDHNQEHWQTERHGCEQDDSEATTIVGVAK